jgi:hypothetical protein
MGCDIHIWAERNTGKQNEYGEPVWEHVPSARWYQSAQYVEEQRRRAGPNFDPTGFGGTASPLPCFDPGRNYTLFSVLANVRNDGSRLPILIDKMHREGTQPEVKTDRYGYASFDHVSVRGVPGDASDFFKARVYDFGGDGHSHSWLTLRELQEYSRWDDCECSHFVEYIMPALAKLAPNPDNVRIVFFFDN